MPLNAATRAASLSSAPMMEWIRVSSPRMTQGWDAGMTASGFACLWDVIAARAPAIHFPGERSWLTAPVRENRELGNPCSTQFG